ncbi:hypothetical protein AbraIFM66951_005024 [Aspergillus brasiliensis]|uniref:Heterokaryon incompatibility domain-containing protein n=1 Tax=Aspergillus brasiliensis TaxID=319629 RepID=A0A9W6DTT3_9EURO|nr:hypothetical protein AbraCBS73388_003214 [Aspergillus brasiliensis]GKZ51090.1 hypothetical protein AbraIFM66951_005024 [Aspergillus brasiliensis]
MSFQYDALDPAQRQIRLLSIHPSITKSGPVHCSLHTVSLNDNPKFEALSYVWGTNDTTERIFLDGNEFYVTPNVGKALYQLRCRLWRRDIWVDAICINQRDVDEKNTQVPLMATLYTTADRVVAMLGDATPEIELVATWTERYVDRKFTIGALYWWWLDIASKFSIKAKMNRLSAVSRALLGVCDLSTRPYWFRMWTYQEYLLPKREPLIVCGNVKLQMSKAPGSDRHLWHQVLQTLRGFDVDYTKGGAASQAFQLRYQAVELYSKTFLKHREITAMRETMQSSHMALSAPNHLANTRDRQCQDPRDKIYALYGVIPTLQKAYPPDYNKTFEQIALETTIWIFHKMMISSLFYYITFSARDPLNTSLPSWVPDYQGQNSKIMFIYRATQLSHVRLELPKHMKLYNIENRSILHLPALRAGKCQALMEFSTDWRRAASELLDVFEKTEKQWARTWDISLLLKRLILVLYRFFSFMKDRSVGEILAALRKLAHSDPSTDKKKEWEINDATESFIDTVESLNYHTLFLAENSFGCIFGISPGAVEDGDIFTIPYTLDSPLILRVAETSERNDERRYYRIVGQAFAGVSSLSNPFCDSLTQDDLEEFLVI